MASKAVGLGSRDQRAEAGCDSRALPRSRVLVVNFNATVENLIESDNIVTVQHMETDQFNVALTLDDNFQELETACPEWQQDTKAMHPQWLERHQSGHLTKDPGCPVCMEEAGSKVSH